MCKECGRELCPPGCPEFDHILPGKGSAAAFCALCGQAIYRDESFYLRGGTAVCPDCGETVSADELGLLCGTDDILLMCGFERVYLKEEE